MFSDTLLDHFNAPRNVGEMPGADAEAEAENPVCGDRLHLWLRLRDGRIECASWQAEGCAPTLAAASMATELLRGLSIAEAQRLDRVAITDALGGLPSRKAHAAVLVETAIRLALRNATAPSGSMPHEEMT
jgi:nitrogen fixation NifU-like protein